MDIKFSIPLEQIQRKMQASARKLIIARHSGAEFQMSSNRVYKFSPNPVGRQILGTRRINTQVNEKKSGQKKYILKKNRNESTFNLHSNSKQSSYSKQKSNAWDKTFYNQNQWMTTTKDQQSMKKSAQKPVGVHFSKVKQLQKIIRNKKENHQHQHHQNQNEQTFDEGLSNFKPRNKARVLMDCESILFSKKSTQINLENSGEKNWFEENKPKYQINHEKLLGSGTFGKVYAGKCNRTGHTVAIKTFQIDKSHKCRQVELMEMVKSKFVIKILDKFNTVEKVKDHQKQYVNIIMPKYQSSFFQFLKARNYIVEPSMLKIYLYQIFKGVSHLHSKNICHRDLKPQNVLISKNRLVICDLGSAKILKKSQPNISYICSRCYRAPELIFGSTFYSFYIDIWSIGCIILEILNKGPFFIAKDSLHHLIQIMKVMGTPTKKQVLSMNPNYDITCFQDIPIIQKKPWQEQFPKIDTKLLDLIQKIMVYSPLKRLTAEQALQHPYFAEIRNTNFIMSVSDQIDCYQLFNSM